MPPLTFYVSGSDLPRQIKSHFSWERGAGGRTVDIITGLQSQLDALIPGWKLVYDQIQLTPDENSPLLRAELVVNDPEPEIVWEVIPTLAELDLLETPVAWPLRLIDLTATTVSLGVKTMNLLEWIRFLINNPDERAFSFADDTAQRLYELMTAGMRAVPRYLPCLRLTETVSSRYDQQLSVTFVGAVLSTTALYAAEGVPADVLFSFPADPPARDGFTWGWLKAAPGIRRTGRGYFNITQDWQYGEYPNLPVGLFTFVP